MRALTGRSKLLIAALALLAAVGGGAAVVTSHGAPAPSLTAVDALVVKGKAPMTGYSRDQFGVAWFDVDGNRCDTRDDILAAQLTGVRKSGRCIVIAGTLADPYTGQTIPFTRGTCTTGQTVGCSNNIQIDHVVPLGNAWVTGAQQLDANTRRQLANDPVNLLAVDGPTNEAKGDRDAATWLPPNRAEWCKYVATQVVVKTKYRLWVTQPEKEAMRRVLTGCS